MKTPAQTIKQQMEIIKKGMQVRNSPRAKEIMQVALDNAAQMMANLEETERLTRNIERLN
ncbi:MAG: hypothetical protein EOP49_27450 [Sphingobacteriales bacterium]|nr:MAG: hypothetical protein EOP49_27450 [Sphingobacteriales bacterium]